MPRWYARSNHSVYFFNASSGKWGINFGSGEDALGNLSALFFSKKKKSLSPVVGSLRTMPVKKYGLRILNSVMSAKETFLCFQWGSGELVQTVTGGGAFYKANHLLLLR